MTEYYNLPVRFTEEERARYAAWGMKKEKTLKPFGTILVLIDLAVTACTVLYLLGLMRNESGVYVRLVAGSKWLACAGEFAVVTLSFLIIKPLDLLCDKIYKKPKTSRMVRLEPKPLGVQYELTQGKEVLLQGILLWDEWEKAVDVKRNELWLPDEWLPIGANTIETIYPEHKRHKWMDRPAEKSVGTIKLGEIQNNIQGYIASLEEQEREAAWLREHGPV